MIYKPRFFTLRELFPRPMLEKFSEDFLWSLMDEGLLTDIDTLRLYLDKPIYINYNGMQCRGFRDCNVCRDAGAPYSAHRFGQAVDLNVEGVESEDVRQFILDNQDLFPHIKRMEKDVSWVHIDTRDTGLNEIYLFEG